MDTNENADETCPHCGYCRHCGRSNQTQPVPYVAPNVIPFNPYPNPYWGGPAYPYNPGPVSTLTFKVDGTLFNTDGAALN